MLLTRTLLASTATLPRPEVSGAEISSSRVRVVRRQATAWWGAALAALTLAVLLVHGFHPLAEDGGLYVAGVEWKLNPSLFPHFTEFVSEHLRFSVFAPVSRRHHSRDSPLPAHRSLHHQSHQHRTHAHRGTRRTPPRHPRRTRTTRRDRHARRGLDHPHRRHLAAADGSLRHRAQPLDAALPLGRRLRAGRLARQPRSLARLYSRDRTRGRLPSAHGRLRTRTHHRAPHPAKPQKDTPARAPRVPRLAAATILQARAPAESAAVILAAESRYYWFLSQWHWYEIFGLIGPLLVLLALRQRNHFGLGTNGKTAVRRSNSLRLLRDRTRAGLRAGTLPRSHHRASSAAPRLS